VARHWQFKKKLSQRYITWGLIASCGDFDSSEIHDWIQWDRHATLDPGRLRTPPASPRIEVRFYQAGSSEMHFGFGTPSLNRNNAILSAQIIYPVLKGVTPLAVNYKEAYNLFACNGIRHEVP